MKKLKLLTCLLFIILLINACSKGCPDGAPTEKNVDKTYLPYIIPYSDTSTRLFLKNGKDTLLFKSQGLKETTEIQGVGGESCDTYKLQQYSLKMAASDTDFFEIKYYSTVNDGFNVRIISNNLKTKEYSNISYISYFPPIYNLKVLNNYYDTVMILPEINFEEFYLKPKLGIIKINMFNKTYELIK